MCNISTNSPVHVCADKHTIHIWDWIHGCNTDAASNRVGSGILLRLATVTQWRNTYWQANPIFHEMSLPG